MTETQSTFSNGDLVTAAIHDLMTWHGHALTRIFYPHLPTEVAPIAIPETVANLPQLLNDIPEEGLVRVQKSILIVRDASAAMAAESVTGHVPDYRAHVEFQKYYQDLVAMLRALEYDLIYAEAQAHMPAPPAAAVIAPIQMAAPMVATPLAPASTRKSRDEETPLQRYVREQQGTARQAP